MAFIKTTDKMDAINAFITEWCKDQTFYCGNCGDFFNPSFHAIESCCETPMFGRNIDHLKAVINENKVTRSLLNKPTGATKNDSIRYGINIPARLYRDLENYFKKHGEKLFNDERELHQFMRKFKALTIPEKV